MNGNEIREKFLNFFAARDHQTVESSSLVPHDDQTLLFVNSGMVQFKKVFTGEEKRDYVRATSCQRSVRAGGKHNDLENVGYTARHHTFFEMLGNFSFGDYFKKEAIAYAWEFLTKVLELPKEKLWVTVFNDDDEAFALWEKAEGLLPGRIVRMGEKDNFWAMGDTGPCGPCSEIHYDQGAAAGCGRPECALGCECDRFLELWNLVFMQFYRDESGKMTPLPQPSIDTGMGLERVAAVLQGKFTNYDSDIFTTLMDRISFVSGVAYGAGPKSDTALRVIADHARATTFLVADGVLPSNEGRGYVLRRIMRRAIRYGRTLGMTKPFLATIVSAVVRQMGNAYPHLLGASELLTKVVTNEEERFLETIDNGLAMLHEEFARMQETAEKTVPGEFMFKLYDTFGFPVDIVRDMALEIGYEVDQYGFNQAMDAQRQQSRKSWKGAAVQVGQGVDLLGRAGHTVFLGYEKREASSVIKVILNESGEEIPRAEAGQRVMIACTETPFYAESGGQVGDSGQMTGPLGIAQVLDTVKAAGHVSLHKAQIVAGTLATGEAVDLKVNAARRRDIEANHSATHLLQAALRKVLGEHVNQSGSLVDDGRLRFDFTHFSPMRAEELARVEAMVNQEIRANLVREAEEMDREAAQKSGATALFGEKYEDTVRVVRFGTVSKELCGGTHVEATGQIGLFKILSETGIAAGVRRLFAVTGRGAMERYQELEKSLSGLAETMKSTPDELATKVKALLSRQKELEREVSQLTAKLSMTGLENILQQAREVKGVKVLCAEIVLDSPKTLREIGDRMRDAIGSGVVVLGGELQGKAALLAIVTQDLTKKCHAGKIIKEVAALVGGSGGGRPDMAQAGGSMPDKVPEALAAVSGIVEAQIGALE
ncbi:MAG: alanine--tRNA ligase [Desulfobulbaceae bacterium]|nr:alanine--tRNA ligase [Desulfobulbaceae bacterium]